MKTIKSNSLDRSYIIAKAKNICGYIGTEGYISILHKLSMTGVGQVDAIRDSLLKKYNFAKNKKFEYLVVENYLYSNSIQDAFNLLLLIDNGSLINDKLKAWLAEKMFNYDFIDYEEKGLDIALTKKNLINSILRQINNMCEPNNLKVENLGRVLACVQISKYLTENGYCNKELLTLVKSICAFDKLMTIAQIDDIDPIKKEYFQIMHKQYTLDKNSRPKARESFNNLAKLSLLEDEEN